MAKERRISPEQFDALAKLLRSRGPSLAAARMVLIEKKTRKEAAENTQLKGPSVSGVVKRFKETHELITSVYSRKRKTAALTSTPLVIAEDSEEEAKPSCPQES